MKIRENFIIICISYTIISIVATIINLVNGYETNNLNVITMFVLTWIAVFILSLHRLFDGFSPLFMIVMQYAIALFCVMLFVFIVGQFNPISEGGYRDIFLSFTVPYVIGACVYYIDVFQTAKKQNELLDEIKKSVENDKKRE